MAQDGIEANHKTRKVKKISKANALIHHGDGDSPRSKGQFG
jgi:hypothetical protein